MWLIWLKFYLETHSYTCILTYAKKSRLYVEGKIVTEAHKGSTWTIFLHFSHILPCNHKTQTCLDITVCAVFVENLKPVAFILTSLEGLFNAHRDPIMDFLPFLSSQAVKLCH